MTHPEIVKNIIEKNITDISLGIIGVNVEKCGEQGDEKESYTIHLGTCGEYNLDLYMTADLDTLRNIAAKMKRCMPADDEISMYVTEFFNIIGGRIVSEINKSFGKKAVIRPPIFSDNKIPQIKDDKSVLTFFYSFEEGRFKIEGHLDKIKDF